VTKTEIKTETEMSCRLLFVARDIYYEKNGKNAYAALHSNELHDVFQPSFVYACSCAEPPIVETQVERSEAVFDGRVIVVAEQKSGVCSFH
jgi:hypothetical protein